MSAPKWLTHFGLSRFPFTKAIADEDLWVPSSRKRIVERLVEACRGHDHVLLTGEPGIGKTCVLRALRHRLPEAGFRLTYCHNATLGRRDFYRQLCLALGLSPSATAAAVFYAINQHVKDLGAEPHGTAWGFIGIHCIFKMESLGIYMPPVAAFVKWPMGHHMARRALGDSEGTPEQGDPVNEPLAS